MLLRNGDQLVEVGCIPLSPRAIPEVAPSFDELVDCRPLTCREVVGDVGSGSRLHDGTVFGP